MSISIIIILMSHRTHWAYFGYSFTKDGLCSCIFKGWSAAMAEMFADFEAQ